MRIEITDKEHPHHGEKGVMTGEVIEVVGGAKMAKVRLDDCPHGIDACFVSKGQVTPTNEE